MILILVELYEYPYVYAYVYRYCRTPYKLILQIEMVQMQIFRYR